MASGTESLLHARNGATFKTWTTGKTWHVHAKHPVTKSWIRVDGLYSEVAAMIQGDAACDKLDAEADRG